MEKPRLTENADADGDRSPSASRLPTTKTEAEDKKMEMNTTDDHKRMDDEDANGAAPPAHEQGNAAPEPEGLKLLFAASQIETNLEVEDENENAEAEAETNDAGAGARVPSSITVVSNGTVAVATDLDVESGSGREVARAETGEEATEAAAYSSENDSETETENLAIAALENQEKSFPQILHEILATTECQSFLHWLPDGLSFIIADKQRFSDVILPRYFRGALLNSFIRKLNRWGFRRVKSRSKGEESSFAHKNFVLDKPWLCLKMRCKSKPTYHKVPSSDNTKKNTKKKKTKQKSTATAAAEVANSKSLVTPATAGIVVPVQPPPLFLAANGNGTLNRAFVPTSSRMVASQHEPLPLPNPNRTTLPKTPAPPARFHFLSTADASTPLERQRQHQHLAYHQQRIFHERQIPIAIAQMRRRHQLQVEMQRLNEMSAQIGEQFSTARRAMQAQYARDMLRNRDKGERK